MDGAHAPFRSEPGGAFAAALAHAMGGFGVIEYPANSSPQTLRIFIIDDKAILAVA